MRQDDEEKEREEVIVFSNAVLTLHEVMGSSVRVLTSSLVNLLAYTIPTSFDEEDIRNIIREIHKVFMEIQREKKEEQEKLKKK